MTLDFCEKGPRMTRTFSTKIALIMRMTAFLLLAFCLQLSARTLSQKITASFKEAKLTEVFDELSRQSGISIIYQEAMLRNTRPVTISIHKMTIDQAMKACMQGQPLFYKLENNIVIVQDTPASPAPEKPSPQLVTMVDIRGRVINAEGQPLAGVNIRSKRDVALHTVTDAEGRFMIHLFDEQDVLVLSYVGFEGQEIVVKGIKEVEVVMKLLVANLNEVVINGYGTQTRANFTGSASKVSAADLANRPYTSLDQSLQGRVTGLQSVAASGQPGASQTVRIRGTGTLSASPNPLYVVDGVIINTGQLSIITTTSNALSGINPNDIESITVLKDASASAIYGSRAANGVIVITTKQGVSGKAKISLDVELGSTYLGKIPDAGKIMTTDQWRQYTSQGLLNNPLSVSQNGLTPENVLDFVDESFGSGNGVNTNWYDIVRRAGQQQQYSLGVSGGNINTQYNISGGYFKQEGTVIGSAFDRYSANMNVRSKVNNRVTVAAKMLIGSVRQVSPDAGGSSANPISAAMHLYPFIDPYNTDGSLNIDPSTFPGAQYNPLYQASYNVNTMNQLKGIGSVDAELRILDHLKFTSRIGFDYNTIEEDNYRNPTYGDGSYTQGISSRAYSRYFRWTWTNMFDYHLDLLRDDALAMNIKAGYQAEAEKSIFSNLQTFGLPAGPTLTVPSNGAIPNLAEGSNQGNSLNSQFSLADIIYKGKYVLSGSFRRDGSSRFGVDNRYGKFWSLGATWNAHEENFIQRLLWVDVLKFRVSYGITGNASLSDYSWRQTYGYGSFNNYNGLGGSFPNSVGNPSLTWEANKQLDLGVDIAFWKNRLAITMDYYNRKADRLLLNQPTSLTTGFGGFVNNVGSVRNSGVELALSGTPIIAGDFKWDLGFNLSRNNNLVISLVNGRDIIQGNTIQRVGMQVRTFYLRQWAGVDPATGSPLWYKDATKQETTSSYNAAALVANYSSIPKVFGGVTSGFSYKGFNLSGLLYYNFGNYIQDFWARITASDGAVPSYNHFATQLNAWTKPGDQTDVPINIYNNSNNSARMSSRFLYKGDYWRLKEVTLSYMFRKKALTAMKMQGLQVYLRGTNLLTWAKDKNLPYDPEQGITGQTDYNIAVPRVFTAGFNIQF